MCGFGESEMVRILRRYAPAVRECERLIFCPVKPLGALRAFLYLTKWHIVEEDIVKEGNYWYSIFCAEKGTETNIKINFELYLGPFNVSRPHPLLHAFVEDFNKRYLTGWQSVHPMKNTFIKTMDRAYTHRHELEALAKKKDPVVE